MADTELVRKLTERNKIADFAMQVLKMDERRADAVNHYVNRHSPAPADAPTGL